MIGLFLEEKLRAKQKACYLANMKGNEDDDDDDDDDDDINILRQRDIINLYFIHSI